MLILPHKKLLGDGPNGENLRDQESLLFLQDKTDRELLQRYRWPDQEEMADCQRRIGQRMHHADLSSAVTRLNPAIFVEQSINYENSLGFYWLNPCTGEKQYLASFDKGWMPEFSFILVDYQNIPETEVRGWRTTLVLLLSKHALTWRHVEEEFGDPTNDLNARRWYAETQRYRF